MHQNTNQNKHKYHVPVLLDEVLQYLDPKSGESYLDLTAGYGGHASAVLERTSNPTSSVLVDRDQNAINELEKRFEGQGITLFHQDFYGASQNLLETGRQFDLILADLGVSSPHLNEVSRGFTLQDTGPLDMRMDQSQTVTAETIVNTYSEAELVDILTRYGEEPKARQIASLIVGNRPLKTTTELAVLAAKAWPGKSRVHPATRTFQALRIAVNDELGLLERSMPVWLQLLRPRGRLAIISFHSLEDRLVKQFFAEQGGDRYDAVLSILTRRPITASSHEIVSNPRARSAKLRVVQRK